MRIHRVYKGKNWNPALKDGLFVLGDPGAKSQKHYAKNEILVRTEDEAIRLLEKGYSIRVSSPTRPSLVRRNLFIYGIPLVVKTT